MNENTHTVVRVKAKDHDRIQALQKTMTAEVGFNIPQSAVVSKALDLLEKRVIKAA